MAQQPNQARLFPFFMFKTVLLLLVGVAFCAAAKFECKAQGVAGNLAIVHLTNKKVKLLEFSDKKNVDGSPALVTTNKTDQMFQFYSCPSPSKNYKNGGQVRSVSNTSLCVTPGNIYHYNDQDKEYYPYPKDADDRLSLQPCETEHNFKMRTQWFMETETSKSCMVRLSQQGWRWDGTSDTVVTTDNGVALTAQHSLNSEPKLHIVAASDQC